MQAIPIRRRRQAVGHAALARAVALMERSRAGASTEAIAEESGLHVVTVRKLMGAMVRHGAAHRAGKGRDAKGRRCVPLFKLGAGK